jgi:hypothetical protein
LPFLACGEREQADGLFGQGVHLPVKRKPAGERVNLAVCAIAAGTERQKLFRSALDQRKGLIAEPDLAGTRRVDLWQAG